MAVSTLCLSDLDLIHNGQSRRYRNNSSVLAQLVKFFISSPPAYLFYACKPHTDNYSRLALIEIRPRATPRFLSGKRLLMSLTICPTSIKYIMQASHYKFRHCDRRHSFHQRAQLKFGAREPTAVVAKYTALHPRLGGVRNHRFDYVNTSAGSEHAP